MALAELVRDAFQRCHNDMRATHTNQAASSTCQSNIVSRGKSEQAETVIDQSLSRGQVQPYEHHLWSKVRASRDKKAWILLVIIGFIANENSPNMQISNAPYIVPNMQELALEP